MQVKTIIPNQILTVENFLSKQECYEYIVMSEKMQYENAPIRSLANFIIRPDVRNNKRIIFDDVELAQKMWEKIKSYTPAYEGRNAIGLNERFRFYRYDIGEFFAFHLDGSYRRENGEQSAYTFMIYLNEDFRGGETEFDLRYPYGEIKVMPKTGMMLLFSQDLRHQGAEVISGRKYVLRSDVMYVGF